MNMHGTYVFGESWFGVGLDRHYNKWIRLPKVPHPKRGTITKYTANPVNDLDTPIYTGIQLKKSATSPKSSHFRVIYEYSTIQDSA